MATLIPKYDQGSTGAVNRPFTQKLQETVSVFDFMTPAQIADVQARTGLLDVSAAIQAAVDSGAEDLYFPAGDYCISTAIVFSPAPDNIARTIRGAGDGLSSTIRQKSGTAGGGWLFDFTLCIGPPIYVYGLGFSGQELPSAPRNFGGIKLDNTNGLYISYCWFRALEYGIGPDNANATASTITIDNCTLESTTNPIEIVRGDQCILSNLIIYGATNAISIVPRGDGASLGMVGNGTVISNISLILQPFGIVLNSCKGTTVTNVSLDNSTFTGGYSISDAVALTISNGEDIAASNITARGPGVVSGTLYYNASAVDAGGTRLAISNVIAENARNVVVANYAVKSTFTNIVGKDLVTYGINCIGSTDSIFTNITIDGCVNGFYANVSERTSLRDMKVFNNSGQPFQNLSTNYFSISETACYNIKADIVSGMKIFNIRGDQTCVTYRNAIPTDVINPYDTVNRLGSIAFDIAPTAGGYTGWICVGEGAPGTWKTFGAISA
jgi:hypothetical protein